MKVHAIPLEQALCPLTRTVAEFLGLEHKGRLAVGCDADILVLNDAMAVNHLWAKGKAVVREKKACVKGRLNKRLCGCQPEKYRFTFMPGGGYASPGLQVSQY